MIRDTFTLRQTNNSTTNATGAGPVNKPGGAPQLPDVVPDGVQDLLDGIFGFTGDMGKAFGDMVSGLARTIQGGGVEQAAQQVAPLVIDVAAVVM